MVIDVWECSLLAFYTAEALLVEGYGSGFAAVYVSYLLSVEQILTSCAHPVAGRGVKRPCVCIRLAGYSKESSKTQYICKYLLHSFIYLKVC
ncbi:MAG: hypothetical protein IJ307_04895 [Bacteroidales bacterium]|nr:hypothetical protein [Bacteroidales bacterium]